jgi:MscS family membrane protein
MFWNHLTTCLETGEACLNGVYGWYWEILTIVGIVVTFNFVFKRLLQFLQKRFHAKDMVLKEAFVTALYTPMSCFIWFFSGIEILDFISIQISSTPFSTSKGLILGIGLILSLGWFLMRWKNNVSNYVITRNRTFKKHFDPATIDIVDKLLTVGIILLVILLLLEITGSNLNTLIAFGGISGLALAFASQEVIASFFGGLMTYITQPFVIGDWIILPEKNIEGHVEEIGWYMTKVRTFDKTPIYVPNSNFSKIVVINPSRMSHRRFKIVIGLRYEDYPKLKAVMVEIKTMLKSNNDLVSEMAQGAYFVAFNTSSLDIEISAYTYETTTEGFKKIREQLLFAIGDICENHNVEMAFPTSVQISNDVKIPKDFISTMTETFGMAKNSPGLN